MDRGLNLPDKKKRPGHLPCCPQPPCGRVATRQLPPCLPASQGQVNPFTFADLSAHEIGSSLPDSFLDDSIIANVG